MKKKKSEQVKLPIMIETSLAFSRFFLVFLALFIAGISYLSGASPAQIFLRTGVSIITMGLLLWIINWWLANTALEAAYANHPKTSDSTERGTTAASGEGQPPATAAEPPATEPVVPETVQA